MAEHANVEPARPCRLNMVVIGAQKAGSTWLMQALDDHPDIHVPYGEVAYFEDPVYHERDVAWLDDVLSGATNESVLGIKRPNLLAHHEAAPRIARDITNAKTIVSLRDPVDRAVSAYWHTMLSGRVPLREMNEGLSIILDGSEAERWPAGQHVLTWGMYAHHLRVWWQHVPRERTLVVLYDDLKAQPRAMLRAAYEFLEVDPDHEPRTMERRPMASNYSMTRLRFRNLMLPMYQRMSDDGLRSRIRRGPIAPLLRKAVRFTDERVLARMFKGKKPTLNGDVRSRLAAHFKDDVAELEEMLGRSLPGWYKG